MKNQKGNTLEDWNWQTKERVEAENQTSSQKRSPSRGGSYFREPLDMDANLEKVLMKIDDDLLHSDSMSTSKSRNVRFNMNSAKTNDTDSKVVS